MKIQIKQGKLRSAIQARGLSMEKFARLCNLSTRTIMRANKGVALMPLTYAKICVALGYGLEEFVCKI